MATSDAGANSMNTDTAPLLAMRGIVKRFGQNIALNGVDLEVRAGEIHALLGENGAGKTTLMHVLAGLTTPEAGDILLQGRVLHLDTPRDSRIHGIAMVHQHFTLVPAFTINENLALAETPVHNDIPPAHLFRKWVKPTAYQPKLVAAKVLATAKALGWNLDGQARVADLPVGVQQRVEIIKALATDARILIFDEPTAVLTAEEVEDLFTVLRQLRAAGRAIILIAHKLAEIMAVGDRVTVLHRGRNVRTVLVSETNSTQLALWMVSGSGTQTTNGTPSPAIHNEEEAILKEPLTVNETYNAPTSRDVPADTDQAAAATEPVLIVTGLCVTGDRGEQALRDLTLQVSRGEILGIGGVDGNGQTELAEALVGLRSFKTGTMTWQGSAFETGVTPRIGYIPQDRRRSGLALSLSVEDNLIFEAIHAPAYRWGPFIRHSKLMALAATLMQTYDIRAQSGSVPVSSLSGGNQQKIVVARALSPQPDLIVAVNPTRGLDISAARFVHAQLRKSRERGAAIVLISTDLDEIAALADRQAILSSGRLTQFASGAQDPVQIGLLLGGIGT